eukprot:7982137-Lingulodinium_polyedra.AAC.1
MPGLRNTPLRPCDLARCAWRGARCLMGGTQTGRPCNWWLRPVAFLGESGHRQHHRPTFHARLGAE